MKAIVSNPGNLVKVQLDLDGKVTITLPGGKQAQGQLSDEELLILAFRVHAITEGNVSFDAELTDFAKERLDHIETLEKQSLAINELREELATSQKQFNALDEASAVLQARLTDCEGELTSARTELKDTRILLSEANAKLGIPDPKPEPATIPPPGDAVQFPEGDGGFVIDNTEIPPETPTDVNAAPAPTEKPETAPQAPVMEVQADQT